MNPIAVYQRMQAWAVATLSADPGLSSRSGIGIVALAVAIFLAFHLWIGLRTGFIPCRLDCGETYEGFVQARNLSRFGWRSAGGLQDVAADPDPRAHPMVYSHNANLTSLPYSLLLFTLGVREIHAQAVWFTVPFLLGMTYLYMAVEAVSGDEILAAFCLLNATSLYLLVELWAHHFHRVWSFPLVWGLTFHLARAFRRGADG